MTDTKLIGARAHAARRQLRRDAGAILAALATAREWMTWKEATGEWPANVDDGQPGGDA